MLVEYLNENGSNEMMEEVVKKEEDAWWTDEWYVGKRNMEGEGVSPFENFIIFTFQNAGVEPIDAPIDKIWLVPPISLTNDI